MLTGLLCAVLVNLCIDFADQPVALFAAAHRHELHVFQAMAAPSLLPLPCAGFYLGYAVLRKLRGGVASGRERLWLTMSIATLAATAAKDELKWMFGRPWPETWLHYGDYNFRPFTNSFMFGSFPSGHTSYVAAPLCVLWCLVPKSRVYCAAVIVIVMVGLVGGGYHFVADVIAGFFTGLAVAAGTLVMMPAENEMTMRPQTNV